MNVKKDLIFWYFENGCDIIWKWGYEVEEIIYVMNGVSLIRFYYFSMDRYIDEVWGGILSFVYW